MPDPSVREFFEILYGDPMPPGKVVIYTTTLKKGNHQTLWCHHRPQADRLCQGFRNTRRVCFSVTLQSQEIALRIARKRRRRARPGNIRGCDAAATALTAVWVVIPFGDPAGPPDLARALGLLEAVAHRPSIVLVSRAVRQGRDGTVYALWRLRQPWIFDLKDPAAADKNAARALIGRVQGAVARQAAEHGWRICAGDAAGSLAAAFPLPGFAAGTAPGGPRAVLEVFPLLAGDGLYRRRDFESLPEPPAADLQPWQDFFEAPATPERPLCHFPPIAGACSWIRACRLERATLSPRELAKAIRLLSLCQAPGADNRRLVHAVAAGHPGYDPVEVDRLLARALRSPLSGAGATPPSDPITCTEIGKEPGVVERHCSSCPHFGRIRTPLELGQNVEAQVRDSGALAAGDVAEAALHATAAPTPSAPRPRIVVTCQRHEVNDQALAALTAGADLFERRGTLVEVVRYPGGPPAVRRVAEARLAELLSRHCQFVSGKESRDPHEIAPPRWTTRGLLARGRWPELPQLAGETLPPSTNAPPKEEKDTMHLEDLWDSDGPSRADLRVLERLGRHRRTFEDLKPDDQHQATVRELLLSLLDVMEETLCEEGSGAPSLAWGWQRVEELEARYWEGRDAKDAPRRQSAGAAAGSPKPEEASETPPAANQTARAPKAA